MIQPIVQNGDPVLRKQAHEVLVHDITSPVVKKHIKNMKDSLRDCADGLAIAAPQIGVSLRIFVVSGKFFSEKSKDDAEAQPADREDMVFVNPVITRRSKSKSLLEEGCLSVRWKYGDILRHDKVSLVAHDEHGKKFTRGASGLLAQVFQHETDHLDGVLFIDEAEDLRDQPPHEHGTHDHDHDGHTHNHA